MVLTVIQNAYLRLAEEHPEFGEVHKKIMLLLLHEHKHYTREELKCLANHSQQKLEHALRDLAETHLVKTEGWLISLNEKALEETLLLEEEQKLTQRVSIKKR